MTVIVTQSVNYAGTSTPGAAGTASFQEFLTNMTNMFAGCGWVNTNAVGTIGPTAVPINNSGSVIGYQVWRFNDWWHNSGSAPVFVRVEYGNLGTDVFGRTAGMALYAGFTHDGSGSIGSTLNGIDSTSRPMNMSSGLQGTSGSLYTHRMCIISGGDMAVLLNEEFAGAAAFGFVERTKDVNGNPTNEGVVVGALNGHASLYRESVLLYSQSIGQIPSAETYAKFIGGSGTSSTYDDNLTVSMLIPMLPYGFGYPSRMVGVVRQNDLENGVTHTISMYGTSSVFYVATPTTTFNSLTSGPAVGTRLIMRHE